MTVYSAYDELADLLATLDSAKIMAMKASGELQERFDELAEKSAEGQLTRQEKDELDHYIVLERLMRLAKIRARTGSESA